MTGADLLPYLAEVARLRIEVFREWPYLYAGTEENEQKYLRSYQTQAALLVLALDGEKVVGASTALPLAEHADASKLESSKLPMAVDDVFYLGESVLSPAYRGMGLGHRFFDAREERARALGFSWTMFCAVERVGTGAAAVQHPACPKNYRPLHDFWRKRGYERRPELVTEFSWPDIGEASETSKPMVFWVKRLSPPR
jgi:GNAT superfamily N-acetyltransferase